jgi:hypothetical protein
MRPCSWASDRLTAPAVCHGRERPTGLSLTAPFLGEGLRLIDVVGPVVASPGRPSGESEVIWSGPSRLGA